MRRLRSVAAKPPLLRQQDVLNDRLGGFLHHDGPVAAVPSSEPLRAAPPAAERVEPTDGELLAFLLSRGATASEVSAKETPDEPDEPAAPAVPAAPANTSSL